MAYDERTPSPTVEMLGEWLASLLVAVRDEFRPRIESAIESALVGDLAALRALDRDEDALLEAVRRAHGDGRHADGAWELITEFTGLSVNQVGALLDELDPVRIESSRTTMFQLLVVDSDSFTAEELAAHFAEEDAERPARIAEILAERAEGGR